MFDQFGPNANQFLQVLLTIGLTLMLGIEREEKRAADHGYIIGGVRTFPLIGLLGYAIGLLSPVSPTPIVIGFAALAAFGVVSYRHKLKTADKGATTEMSALIAYMVGALVARQYLWVAVSVAVASVMLLQAKVPLRHFAVELPAEEVRTFVKFLLLAGVILPVLPNQSFTPFHLNPFKTWLIVVAVSGISYASYILQQLVHSRQSVLLAALLGGAYSSTVTTVALAKQSKEHPDVPLYAGATLLASGVMYVRLMILLAIFNAHLGAVLAPRLLMLALAGGAVGYVLASTRGRPLGAPAPSTPADVHRNPLDLTTALIFAGLFLGISVVTELAASHLGNTGVYTLAGIMGLTDIDPFILGLTQSAGQTTPVVVAAAAVIIAAASNNVLKGLYAVVFGDRRTGLASLAALVGLALVSLAALVRL